MQSAINKTTEWGKANGLTFGREKTVLVIFTRKYKPLKFPPLRMEGSIVPYSTETKYLGITLDNKLSFNKHITDKCKKATKLLMSTRSAIGKLWGPSVKSTRWIYEAMVHPILLYGAIVWAHKLKPNNKNQLRLQRLSLIHI